MMIPVMRLQWLLRIVLLAISLSALCAGVPDAAENDVHRLLNTSNIRKGPDVSFETVSYAARGAQAIELERNGKWIKVKMKKSGRTGWIYASSLEPGRASQDGVKVLPLLDQTAAVKEKGKQVVQPAVAQEKIKGEKIGRNIIQHDVFASPPAQKQEKALIEKVDLKTPDGSSPVQTSPADPQKTHQVYQTSKIRKGPGSLYEMVGWAGKGALVSELERQGQWVKVQMRASGRVGWIDASSLEPVAGVASTEMAAVQHPLIRPSPTGDKSSPATSVKHAASDKKEPLAGRQRKKIGAVSVLPFAPQGGVAKPAEEQPVAGKGLYRFNKNARLRAGPAILYDAIGYAGKDAYAVELERKGDWQKIQMRESKRIGWVYGSSLDFIGGTQASDRVGQVEVIGDTLVVGKRKQENQFTLVSEGVGQSVAVASLPDLATGAMTGNRYTMMQTSTMRKGAGKEFAVSGWIAAGAYVTVLERRNGWVRVQPRLQGKRIGWVEEGLLQKAAAVPVADSKTLIGTENIEEYKDRITHGETFNFSYLALEQAQYPVLIEELRLNMGGKELEALYRKGQYDKSTFEVNLLTPAQTLHGRISVLGSSTRIFKKKSLLIKLDKQGGRWHGHRRIALRSMASDKSMMREYLAWKMMAAMGMKVPEVHYVRVSINRRKVGLYLSIQWMGRDFLAGNNLDVKGDFYQPDDATHCGDLNAANMDLLETCFIKITPADKDYSALRAMARAVSAAPVEEMDRVLASYFHEESVINWVAANALVTNGDTYVKNYWMHRSSVSGKWTMIPWDYNLTFGRTYDPFAVKPYKVFNENFQYYYPPDVGASNPLKDKLLLNPRLRLRLEQRIKHLLGMEPHGPEKTFGWFSPTVMKARIYHLARIIDKQRQADTFLAYGAREFKQSYQSLVHFVTGHAYFLKAKLFGALPWIPVDPTLPFVEASPLPPMLSAKGVIEEGKDRVRMTDSGYGYFVAALTMNTPLKRSAEFKVSIEGDQAPKYLPRGKQPQRCVQRSWVVFTETPNISVSGDLSLEYIQENSHRTEVTPMVHEKELELWMLDRNRWTPAPTYVNEFSNILTARNIRLESGHILRFVACSPF